MADNNKKTIFSSLNSFLNLDGFGFGRQEQKDREQTQKIMLKAETPEQIQKTALEMQQQEVIFDKFHKVQQHGFQKAMQYEAARQPAYQDYEGMEYYPLIASALDLLAEEATTIGDNGKVLNIYSKKERIKTILEDFFYGVANVNVNLHFWARNLAKYGDNFLFLLGEKGKGIRYVRQMVNFDIERKDEVKDKKARTVFRNRTTGDEFNLFEIAHFRLLGDDKYLPYGSSVLNKVRRVFRQCLDSKSKIWTPNGYKLIKDIKIDDTIFSFNTDNSTYFETKVKNVSNNGIKDRFYIKTRHRDLIATNDHPLLVINNDGLYSYLNIDEINTKNHKLVLPSIVDGKNDHTISTKSSDYYVLLNENGVNHTKEIESVNIVSRINKFNTNTSLKNIHTFLRGHKRKIRYDDFQLLKNEFGFNNSHFELYSHGRKNRAIVDKNLNFKITKEFCRFFGFMLGDGWLNMYTKSIGFALGEYDEQNEFYINYLNSLSTSEIKISRKENTKSASANLCNIELLEIFIKCGFITGFQNKRIPDWVFELSKEWKLEFIRGIFDADGCDNNGNYSSSNHNLIEDLRVLSQTCNLQVGKILKAKRYGLEYSYSFKKFIDRKPTYTLYIKFEYDTPNLSYEKITRIDKIDSGEVWDIEVANSYHNFIADGLVVHNCVMAEDAMLTYRILRAGEKRVYKIEVGNLDDKDIEAYVYKVATKFKKQQQVYNNTGQIDYRFNILGNDEDIFVPVRDGKSTVIETLPGATNLDAIADIQYLRDNLFTGLGIPKPFLGFSGSAGEGKNLAQMDVRFAKKVNRLQQALIQELNKMAIVHLYLKGYEEDLSEFSLTLNNPSTQADKLKTETLTAKIQLYTEATRNEGSGIAAVSHTWAKRNILGWSDKEIVEDFINQRMERAISQELQDTPVIIPKTGIFDDIDQKYGNPSAAIQQQGPPPVPGEGTPEANPAPDAGATNANAPQNPNQLPEPQGLVAGGVAAPAPGGQQESKNRTGRVLREGSSFEDVLNHLVHRHNVSDQRTQEDAFQTKTDALNKSAKQMINEIDRLLINSGDFNSDKINILSFEYRETKEENKTKLNEEEKKDGDEYEGLDDLSDTLGKIE